MLRMSKKLNDPSAAPKNFFGLFSIGFSIIKKVSSSPQIFHDSKVISDFKEKTNLFNSFFASQCTPVSSSSVLPDFSFHTNTHLNSFSVTEKDILAINKLLDPNKSYGLSNTSIKMIKMCGESLTLPLKMIFEAALYDDAF